MDWFKIRPNYFDGTYDPLLLSNPGSRAVFSELPHDLTIQYNIGGIWWWGNGVAAYEPVVSFYPLRRRWYTTITSLTGNSGLYAPRCGLVLFGATSPLPDYSRGMSVTINRFLFHTARTLYVHVDGIVAYAGYDVWDDSDLPISLMIEEEIPFQVGQPGHFKAFWKKASDTDWVELYDHSPISTSGWDVKYVGCVDWYTASDEVHFSELITELYGDDASPYLVDLNPAEDQLGVDRSALISLSIVDDLSGVDWTRTDILFGTVPAVSSGVAQDGYLLTTTGISGGLKYDIQPPNPLPQMSPVGISVSASDFVGNLLNQTYYFYTRGVPLFLDNQIPFPTQTGVSVFANMSMDILDDGVEPSSISLYVNGQKVYDGLFGFVLPYSGSVEPTTVDGYSGYHVSFSSSVPFSPSSAVYLRVVAQDIYGQWLDETWWFRTQTKLLSLQQGPYEITLDALFSGPMSFSSMSDASLFAFSNGAYVKYTEQISNDPTKIRLWMEGFQGTEPFVLTASPLDSYGDSLAPEGNSATIVPFQSSAMFSNTTGLVCSWHESSQIRRDTERIYLSGTRGLDIIGARVGTTVSKWSQILDSYGISSFCLSGSAYVFSGTDLPFLSHRSPAPGEINVLPTTNIRFWVESASNAIQIRSLVVRLRNSSIPTLYEIVFSGTLGWTYPGVCGGSIVVYKNALDIELFPRQALDNGTATVIIQVADMLGNTLYSSYSFSIGPEPDVFGFGEISFGIDPFGS